LTVIALPTRRAFAQLAAIRSDGALAAGSGSSTSHKAGGLVVAAGWMVALVFRPKAQYVYSPLYSPAKCVARRMRSGQLACREHA